MFLLARRSYLFGVQHLHASGPTLAAHTQKGLCAAVCFIILLLSTFCSINRHHRDRLIFPHITIDMFAPREVSSKLRCIHSGEPAYEMYCIAQTNPVKCGLMSGVPTLYGLC